MRTREQFATASLAQAASLNESDLVQAWLVRLLSDRRYLLGWLAGRV